VSRDSKPAYDGESPGKPSEAPRGWVPPGWLIPVLAVIAVLLLGANIWFGVLVHNRNSKDDNRDAALQAARQVAVDFGTYDYKTADAHFRQMLSVSTGKFRDYVQKTLTAFVPVLIQEKAVGTSEVRDAAIVLANGNQVSVMTFVDRSVTNAATTRAVLQRYRFLIIMTQVHGKWLVSDLNPLA
jgi:Mce-associated membrane protein